MAKKKYVCQHCGHEELKWMGKCPGCESWNSLIEELVANTKHGSRKALGTLSPSKPILLEQVDIGTDTYWPTGFDEFDRVLGGGVVAGSLVLIGGDPGIGKSTLLLQVLSNLASQYGPVLYVSGEESSKQIKLRATRLRLGTAGIYLLSENSMEIIEKTVQELKPKILVIDSIQTVFKEDLTAAPGSVSQVRECTNALLMLAKGKGVATFIVGHVTKEGAIAGPRVLEHMVDTVLYFEGERHNSFRILRGVKNRFGSTNEIGIFEMRNLGLTEVTNPSQIFLAERAFEQSGSVVTSILEGTRPVMVEIQALVSHCNFGNPRRTVTGLDFNRCLIVCAVLEKRVGLHLGAQDIYINVSGGYRLIETGADLAMAVAIASAFRDFPCDPTTMVVGEVGLTGEVRSVSQTERRVAEAKKLGFKRCIIPHTNTRQWPDIGGIEIIGVETVKQAIEAAMGGR